MVVAEPVLGYIELLEIVFDGVPVAATGFVPLTLNKPGRLYRPHNLGRQRQRNARQRRIRSGQGRAAIIRSDARRRVASSRNSRQRGDARSIDTPIIGKVFTGKDEVAQIREKMIGMIPMKRWGTSEEIAKAVLFLAFDATFTTGAEIPVDGGWSQL